jgi:hypothetical protein
MDNLVTFEESNLVFKIMDAASASPRQKKGQIEDDPWNESMNRVIVH